MTEEEMIEYLQTISDNMTFDKDRNAYQKMLSLLDDMVYFLRYDLQIPYESPEFEELHSVEKFEF